MYFLQHPNMAKETKLWVGRYEEGATDAIERFTELISFDKALYKHDVKCSRAHASMLAKQVRPNAITLVESFNYTGHYLGLILGRYDGNVYPKLYEVAWKDPLNDSDVVDGFHEFVQPILKQKLRTSKL